MTEKNGKKMTYGLFRNKGKILFIKDEKEIWNLPGGKTVNGESDMEYLARIIPKQLPGFAVTELEPYHEFRGRNSDMVTPSHAMVYTFRLDGEVEKIQDHGKARLFTRRGILENHKIFPITRKIIESTY